MNELETLKMNIKFYRVGFGWSQDQLAERMNVSRSVITRLESGEQAPELSYLISLSNAFNVSIDHLLGRNKKENPILHEVYARYETESNLEEIIDYLVKTPHLLEQIERVTLLKSKTRKHVEELLISNIEHILKIIE